MCSLLGSPRLKKKLHSVLCELISAVDGALPSLVTEKGACVFLLHLLSVASYVSNIYL